MPNVGRKKGKNKNLAGSNNRPAEHRYWNSARLRAKKIRNLMRYNGLTRQQAENTWDLLKHVSVSLKKNPRK